MNIPSAYIIDYLTQNLSFDYRISSGGKEFVCPSIYLDRDPKRHMSINLYSGVWRCFKTGNSGTFIKLVSEIEKVTYREAFRNVLFRSFNYKPDTDKSTTTRTSQKSLDLTDLIQVDALSGSSDQDIVLNAWDYLYKRKLFDVKNNSKLYYVSNNSKFHNRVIIPFTNEKDIYFYQARALTNESFPKYLSPPAKNEFFKSSNVLYKFDETKDYVVVVEGPLCAISLQIQGINATSIQGSYVSRLQAEYLKEWGGKIILGFDNDKAGEKCLSKFDNLRKRMMMDPFYVTAMPNGCKDWNEAHVKSIDLTQAPNNAKQYNFNYKILDKLNSI